MLMRITFHITAIAWATGIAVARNDLSLFGYIMILVIIKSKIRMIMVLMMLD